MMKVNVLINTNTFTLDEIDPCDTVESIKDNIYDKLIKHKDVSAPNPDNPNAHTYITTNHLRLLYKGKQLPKLSTLQEHGFKSDDTLLLFVSQKQQEDPQDDINEIIHSTMDNTDNRLKYTLTIKNDHQLTNPGARDAEMMEILEENQLKALLARIPFEVPKDSINIPPAFDREVALPSKAKKNKTTFPPTTEGTQNTGPSAPPAVRVIPLTVESFSPVNKIFFESPVRVKFSQPMVPIGEFDKLQSSFPIPVSLSPSVEGEWKWVDPFTVTFTPNREQGYPKSTEFTCLVKGNLSSAVGGVMRDSVEWKFSSASLNFENRTVSFSGKKIQVFLQFNQPIVLDKVFSALVVTTSDEEILDCNLLNTEKKEDLHFTIQKAIQNAKQNTFLVFEIEDDINGVGKIDSLPIEVEVNLNPYVLDLEKKLSFKFKTVASLKVKPIKKTDLKGKPIVWPMSSSLTVQFTNTLLAETTQEQLQSYVTVVPNIPNMKLIVIGDALSIQGQKLPGDYKVTLHTTILDIYGQNLGEEVTVDFPVSAPTTPYLEFDKTPGYDFNTSCFVTLDPALPPVVHFKTRNVRELMVVAYSVSPMQHHQKFLEFTNARDKTFPNFLHEVWRKTIEVSPPLQEEESSNNNNEGTRAWYKDARSTVDLSKAFGCDDLKICGKNKESQLVVVVNAIDTVEFAPQAFCKKFWLTWSDVGISYLADEDTIYGWSYSLLTGEMLNCNMYLCDSEGETLPLEKGGKEEVGAGFVKATTTESLDFKFLAAEIGNRSALVGVANIFRSVTREKYVWHVVDDRANFRPFDRVHIKGIIRERTPSGRLIVPKDADTKLTYSVYDSRNKIAIKATVVDIKPSFCFDFDFEVPGSIHLGQTFVNISLGDTKMIHTINVQEYKRKAFDMVMTRDKPTLRSQEPLRLTSYAQAFTGEVLSGTSATWSVRVSPAQYTPPKLGIYNFGAKSGGGDEINLSNRYTWESPKNYSGKHNLAVSLDHIIGPTVLGVSCTVVDGNTNEELSANESVVVHPTDVYVGIRAEQQFVNFGEAYKFFAVTCDPSGNFTGNCALHMYVRGTPFETYDGGEHAPPDVAVVDVPLTPSEEGPIEFSFEPKFRGKHSVTIVSTDLNGRTSSTGAEFWVYGAQSEAEKEYQEIKQKEKAAVKPVEPPPHYKGQVESLELVLDDKSNTYVSGSKAELLIVSPFWPAQGALHIHKNGTIIKAEKFDVTDAMTRLKIDILEEYLPGVYVEVGLVGISSREAPKTETKSDPTAEPTAKKPKTDDSELSDLKKPSAAKGSIKITVSHEHKKLSLSVSPAATTYLPGGEASVDIDVVDHEGKPVEGAEVTLVVVDEAVLALTGYSLKDPRAHFYCAEQSQLTRNFTMNSIMFTRLLPKDALPVLPVAESTEVITISYFNGRMLRFTLNNSIPVSQLKALIQERDGLPPTTQRLLYNGKQLTDEGTLEDQGVPNGATINLVLRLFGGGLGDDKVMPEEAPPPIRIRTNMNALAFFGPHLTTQKNGKLTTKFTLPDSLTRYRVMAMANTIDQFGAGDSSLVVCLPLMVKQSPPRFLNFGDSCTVPVVVQNETNEEKEVVIGIRSVGDEVEIENPGWKFKIAPRGRTSVPFHVKPKGPGSATFHVAASDSSLTSADAVQFSFPVQAPITTEVFANSGFIDGDNVIQQPIAQFTNDSVVSSVGGMQVSLASTIFQELTDAALYVINYPYLCTEQLGSRLISLVAFKDMLPLLHKVKRNKKDPVPTPENLNASVNEIITSLVDRKDSAGNFGYWEKNGKSYDYASVFTYHALSFAIENDFEVPVSVITSGKTFLRNIINKYEAAADPEEKEEKNSMTSGRNILRTIVNTYEDADKGPNRRSNVSRWLRGLRSDPSAANAERKESNSANHALACYAVYVLSQLAPNSVRRQEALSMLNRKKLEKTPIEQIAWLLPSILEGKQLKINLKAVYEHINNSITQTGQTAHFANINDDNDLFFRSDVRHNAVALHVLLEADPKHSVIPKLMRGLLDVRKNGLWLNTQDNAFSLLAMNKYFNMFEKDGGMYIADLWVGKGHAGHTEYNGLSTDTNVTRVPMNFLIEEKDSTVTLAKKGQGRLYYRIAVEYAPKSLFLPPRDSGFKITRTYEAVTDKSDVENSIDENGRKIVTIKAGAKIQIKVVMVAESVRSYVALVDHLPGGLEPQNVNARRTGTYTGLSYVYRFWDHQNIRDSRVEVFVDLLYPGLYVYSYTVKAMTKGSFVVPPAKAEEMYSPDVYGRSDMMIVNVK